MLCDNCGKRTANVRYTQIINGNKKEMMLCEECSQKLGIRNMDFNMPLDFSSFLSDFWNEFQNTNFISTLTPINQLKCNKCGLLFEDFMNTGKFGCQECYNTFEDNLDELLKSIQGGNKHIGRIGKTQQVNKIKENAQDKSNKIREKTKLDKLQENLQLAIKEERYEDAAKIRDEISKLNK